MENTIENRKIIEEHFKNSDFKPAGGKVDTVNTHSFMLFGCGWGCIILKCICIQFDSERLLPHIEIEYSPCSKPSRYFYMELTKENILKLPKTEKEFFDNYFPLMKMEKADYYKK
jgi:hypothetical protein